MSNVGPYTVYTDWKYSTNGSYAFAKKDGKEYFIKQMMYPKFPNKESVSKDTYRRMADEAEAWERSTRSMHKALSAAARGCDELIVPVDLILEKSTYYIVSPKKEGYLSTKEISALSEKQKLKAARSFLKGLVALERKGIVHGDLKAENIMVLPSDDGYATAIFDFEESYISGKPRESNRIGGSVECFSPELSAYIEGRADAEDMTTKSDVFSAAIVMYGMITGKYPSCSSECTYTAKSEKDIDLSGSPEDMVPMFRGMLAINPTKRLSASKALSMLDDILGETDNDEARIKFVNVGNGYWKITTRSGSTIVPRSMAEAMAKSYGITMGA